MPETIATDARAAATIAAIERFNEAFNRHDVDAVMAAMTDDCVFETSFGPTVEAVRAVWEEFFRSSPRARFETEELFAAGHRCTVRWIYHWLGGDGREGHVRGVDVFHVRDGKVAEKLSYVKG